MTALKIIKWMIVSSLFTIMLLVFLVMFLLTGYRLEKMVDPYVIVGKTRTEITEIYGEFDMESEDESRYHIYTKITDEIYMRIFFDEEGKADRCRIGKLPGG